MSVENHYKTLDISETANMDEIKKAYRKLSLKYHPDKNPGKPEVVELFQKISEAYETLGDNEKKNSYDMMRKNPFMRMGTMGNNANMSAAHSQEFADIHNNINDLFANLFFGGNPANGLNGLGGNMGGMGGIHINGLGGMGFSPGANVQVFRNGVPVNIGQQQAPQKPAPIIKTITISMEKVLNGAKVPTEIERWILENGNKVFETVTVYVDIFKGIDQNELILLKEEGNVINDTCKGDVKIFVKIENETEFTRRGLDLILDKNILLKDSLCGFSFDLKYVNGKNYTINNHAGNIIPPEYQKVIPNMGLTREQHVGNLIIHFHVEFPTSISLDKIEVLKGIL